MATVVTISGTAVDGDGDGECRVVKQKGGCEILSCPVLGDDGRTKYRFKKGTRRCPHEGHGQGKRRKTQ